MFRVCVFAALLTLLVSLVSLDAQEAKPKGKKYAVLVGVADYKHRDLAPLKFTENDVVKLAALLKDRAGFDEVRLLTGDKTKDVPTAANVRAALAAVLAKKGRDDTVLVALSGHGVQLEVEDPAGKGKAKTYGFFCPSDADLAGVDYKTGKSETLINLDHLLEDLGGSGAGVKLVLVDACRNEMQARARSLDVKSVTIPEGVAALFSCKSGQRAFETDKLKHGVFFHRVLKGLEGEASDRKGRITWGTLSEYVTEAVTFEVPKLIGGGAKQTPHEVRNLVGSPPVLVVPGGRSKESPAVVIEGGSSEIDDGEVARLKADEAKKRKTELLRDILLDLPGTLMSRARAHDSDDYDAESSKLAVDVTVMPNEPVYTKYLRELQTRLKKISIRTEDTSVKAKPADLSYFFTLPKTAVKGFGMERDKATWKLAGPDLSKDDDAWCIWVLTAASQKYDQTRWTGYVVDADPVKVLRAVHGTMSLKVDLLDNEGERITGEEFDLGEHSNNNNWLGYVSGRSKAPGNAYTGDPHSSGPLLRGASVARITSDYTFNVHLGPLLFHSMGGLFWNFRDASTSYTPQRTYRREYTVTKDEFKKLKTIRCTLVFKKTKPKE